MGTDDVHFGNSKNFLSVEELENVVKITSIESRIIHLKNLLVPLEEVFGSADFWWTNQSDIIEKEFVCKQI